MSGETGERVYSHYTETHDGRNVQVRRVVINDGRGTVYNNLNGHEFSKELTPEEVSRYLDERLDVDGYHYLRRQMNQLTRQIRGLQRNIARQWHQPIYPQLQIPLPEDLSLRDFEALTAEEGLYEDDAQSPLDRFQSRLRSQPRRQPRRHPPTRSQRGSGVMRI